MTEATTSPDASRNDLLKVAAAGIVTGLLTPLCVPLIDKLGGAPTYFRIALVAVPFAVLVFAVVRRHSANPWWAALTAAIVTMIAFVVAVNTAIFIDGQSRIEPLIKRIESWAATHPAQRLVVVAPPETAVRGKLIVNILSSSAPISEAALRNLFKDMLPQ